MTSSLIVVAGIWRKQDKILLTRRKANADHPNCWEFPGGKVEADETLSQALCREWREELGVDVGKSYLWLCVPHQYEKYHVQLNAMMIDSVRGEPAPQEGQGMEWVSVARLSQLQWPDANWEIVKALG